MSETSLLMNEAENPFISISSFCCEEWEISSADDECECDPLRDAGFLLSHSICLWGNKSFFTFNKVD